VRIDEPKSIEEALKEGTWAITIGHSSKYIGQLWGIDDVLPARKSYFVAHLTNPIIVRYALSFLWVPSVFTLPRARLSPVGWCTDVESFQVYTTPFDIIFFEDMLEQDKQHYKDSILKVITTMRERRLHPPERDPHPPANPPSME